VGKKKVDMQKTPQATLAVKTVISRVAESEVPPTHALI
jgi:hypothetical protein